MRLGKCKGCGKEMLDDYHWEEKSSGDILHKQRIVGGSWIHSNTTHTVGGSWIHSNTTHTIAFIDDAQEHKLCCNCMPDEKIKLKKLEKI